MSDDSVWIERAQSAEARISTMKQTHEAAAERIKDFKTNFGIRERGNGEIVIDYDKFVARLGLAGSMELRKIIDTTYHISGSPGEKPRLKMVTG